MKKPLFQYRLVLAVIFSFGASATAQWLAIDSGLTGTGVDNCFAVNGNTARKINYALPKPCLVTIRYHDLQGRTACSFVNKLQQPGYYSVSIGARSPSGKVYIQEFRAGDFVKNERLVAVR